MVIFKRPVSLISCLRQILYARNISHGGHWKLELYITLVPKNHARNGETRNDNPKDFILKTKQTSHNVTCVVQPTNLSRSSQQTKPAKMLHLRHNWTGFRLCCGIPAIPGKKPIDPIPPKAPIPPNMPCGGNGNGVCPVPPIRTFS